MTMQIRVDDVVAIEHRLSDPVAPPPEQHEHRARFEALCTQLGASPEDPDVHLHVIGPGRWAVVHGQDAVWEADVPGGGERIVYTPEEVAELLKLSRETVRRLMRSGELAAAKIGRQWRITHADLRAFLQGAGAKTL